MTHSQLCLSDIYGNSLGDSKLFGLLSRLNEEVRDFSFFFSLLLCDLIIFIDEIKKKFIW